jgi:hypothetical protein
MIQAVTYYCLTTGVVISSGRTDYPELVCPEGAAILKGITADPQFDRVEEGAVIKRSVLGAAINTGVLTGVPAGAVLEIEGVTYTADGTDISLVFDLPGKYLITINAPPYLPQELMYEIAT